MDYATSTPVAHFAATVDNTPKALKVSAHERHVASLEGAQWTFKATVKRALQLMDTAEIVRDKLAGFFVGQTPEQVKALLLPEVAQYYGCAYKTAKSSGKVMLSSGDKAYARTARALDRLVAVIVGEQNDHREALEASEGDETAESKAKPSEEVAEPSEALIAAVAALVKKSGADKKTMAKAVAKAFALLK